MLDLFINPGFLAAAGALVSAPIIIHLINRMRFKRIRWAAMEFLLKAQKRMRKRLIIEQLLLLMLRCLLVALVGLLVMRFVGLSMAEGLTASKKSLHLVLVDDTLSKADTWKDGDMLKDAFGVAKNDVLIGKIGKGLSQSSSTDRLQLILLSQVALDPGYKPKVYERLNDGQKLREFNEEVDALQATKLHVPILQGVRKVRELVNANNATDRITIHILSDFRHREWDIAPQAKDGEQGKQKADQEENVAQLLIKMTKDNPDLKVRLIDTVGKPERQAGQGAAPTSHDNVGIVDFRAGTRIAGKDMPVTFTVTLANFTSREVEVEVVIFDESTGAEQHDIRQLFHPPMPVKIPPDKRDFKVTFDKTFSPQIKANEPFFGHLSARLESPQRGKLEGDAIIADNVRYATVEIRDRVPVLVVDGDDAKGRSENGDSFFLEKALISVPGASYEIKFGYELGGGSAVKALERSDLQQFASIFMVNVRELNPKQLANLETYVREGGGVSFFMGPRVNPAFYNKALYKGGKGIFPVPLKDTYYPPQNDEALKPEYTGVPHMLLRKESFPNMDMYPIFGQVFREKGSESALLHLPIRRYFQVPRTDWNPEPGRVFELATLPNELAIDRFQRATLDIVDSKKLEELLATDEFAQYRKGIQKHRVLIKNIVGPTSEKKAIHLAQALENMLADQGVQSREKDKEPEYPNLTHFWSKNVPVIATLRDSIRKLIEQTKYGDPFVIAADHGKGKVVATMSTAGKEWNDWGGGSDAMILYQPFIWEMQNYLSSQGSDENRIVGSPLTIRVDVEPFKQKQRGQLKMTRVFYKTEQGKAAKPVSDGESFGDEDKNIVTFRFDKNVEPGLYVATLQYADAPDKTVPLAAFGHVFNVPTELEGQLARVSTDTMNDNLISKADKGAIQFEGPNVHEGDLVSRRTDLSESPWLFLIFILVLVAEQALAVHLSFHLKGSETEALSRATTVQKQAA